MSSGTDLTDCYKCGDRHCFGTCIKTLLFAPMYLDEGDRLQRNVKWLEYYYNLRGNLKFDHLLLVDNASNKEKLKTLNEKFPFTSLTIQENDIHLPRLKSNGYSYWYYAFGQAAKYAMENNYDKILHCDSDVFLTSQKIVDWCNNTNSGWVSQWCFKYNYPESTFQIINKDSFEKMHKFMTRDFLEYYPNDMAETRIPWTHNEKGFNGDRFGEYGVTKQDPTWDWIGQTPVAMEIKFNG